VGDEVLKEEIRRVFGRRAPEPACSYGFFIKERVSFLESSLREIKGRVNFLIFAVISAILVEIILRLGGL